MSAKFKCEELGHVELVELDKKRHAGPECIYFTCERGMLQNTVDRINNLFSDKGGLDKAERSNHNLPNGKNADLVLKFQPGINEAQAKQTAIDLMNRFTHLLNLETKHNSGGVAMAIHSNVRHFD